MASTRTASRKTTTTTRRRPAKRRGITPEDLMQFVLVSSPQLSPDGGQVMFVRKHIGKKNTYETNLWMVDTNGDAEPRQFSSSGEDSAPRWSPDGETIAFISNREKPKPQVYMISAAGGEATKLTDFPEGSVRDFKWAPDGRSLAVVFRAKADDRTEAAAKARKEKGLSDPPHVIEQDFYRLDGDGYFNKQRYALYIVDVETGDHRLLYDKDTFGFFDYDFAPDSSKVVIATNRDKRAMLKPWKDELLVVNVRSGRARSIPGLPPGPKTTPRWSPDGKTLAYAGREGMHDSVYSTENIEIYVCDPVRGNARSLTAKDDYCLMAIAISDTSEVSFEPAIQWSTDSKRIHFRLGHHGESQIASVARRGGAIRVLTGGSQNLEMGNLSGDGRCMALVRGTPTALPEIAVGTIRGDAMDIDVVTNLNGPLLREVKLSKPKSHWVKAADGTRSQVWTIMPPGHSSGSRRKYPAVLEIHGGPHGQYGVSYFHEMQVLAANGYVVFFSNPRGSKGYGRDFCNAIRGTWGTADWEDMQAVIAFMKSHPNVNTKRMGVMGGSYGGYMTNWIIGHTNDFAGAITDRCVSNMVSMGGNSDFFEKPDDYFPGNFWDRPEQRWEQSPIKYFGNVRTPTLIIHSEGDLRCNIEQGEQVYAALRIRNVPTRFVRYPRNTSHGMSRGGPPDLRLHRLGEILDWWGKWLRK